MPIQVPGLAEAMAKVYPVNQVSVAELGTDTTKLKRVLETEEIFEHTLLYLPIKNLLITAPLVCKKWQVWIMSSPKLRKALFSMPLKGSPLQYIQRNTTKAWAENENDPHAYTVLTNPFYG